MSFFATHHLFLILGLAAGILFTLFYVNQQNKKFVDLPETLYKGKKIMSKEKIEFHKRLLRLLSSSDYIILPQISVSSLIVPNLSKDHFHFKKVRERYSSKIIDYAILSKDYEVLFLIELEEKQGENNKNHHIYSTLKKSGYKILNWNVQTVPNNKDIQLKIMGKCDANLENNGMM